MGGIFRKNPDKTKMLTKLDYLESEKGILDLNKYLSEDEVFDEIFENVHQAAGLLKLFLRELPESIIPKCHFDHLADVQNTAQNLRQGVLNEDSVKLFKLLAMVSKNKEKNLMSSQALAVVFAPILCG